MCPKPPYTPESFNSFYVPDEPPCRTVTHDDRESWLRARHAGIGGSDVSAILGLSRFRGPWSVWRDKVDKVVEPGWGNNMAEWGHRHEPAIALRFSEVLADKWPDCQVIDPGDYTSVWANDTLVPLFCTPDRLITRDKRWVASLEEKCAWHKAAKEWEKHVPFGYQAQLQFTMLCCGVRHGFFAVLLNGCEFRWYEMERNDRFIQKVMPKLRRFWECVTTYTPPSVDFSQSTARSIAAHYDDPKDKRVELPEEFVRLDTEREQLGQTISNAEKRKACIDSQIKATLGNATLGVLPDQETAYTWRPTAKGSRRLLRTILKGEPNGKR